MTDAVDPRNADSDDRTLARDLILRFGWNSTCYQILNPGIDLWFSGSRDAVVGSVTCHGVAVVVGAPVCHVERLTAVLEEWHQWLAARRTKVCYFGAEERLNGALVSRTGFQRVVLGSQPVWRSDQFISAIHRDARLRYQLSRARNKRVIVEEWDSERAIRNAELRSILDEWLETRGLPPMHFMVEPYTLECLQDRRLFVALRADRPVAFVVLTPVPERNGWLTEQFVRGRSAPNGTIELLLAEAVGRVCEEGSHYLTMGIVPLSDHCRRVGDANPRWLRWFLLWFRAHGRKFYNFKGLEAFKDKFHPEYWEPIYAISMEPRFSPLTLYSIARAFCCESPMVTAFKGLGRAARQELSWAIRRRVVQ